MERRGGAVSVQGAVKLEVITQHPIQVSRPPATLPRTLPLPQSVWEPELSSRESSDHQEPTALSIFSSELEEQDTKSQFQEDLKITHLDAQLLLFSFWDMTL